MRGVQLLKAAILAVAVAGAPGVAEATPQAVVCVGTTTLGPPTNYAVTDGPGVTVETWDFTGVQDFCLADGTVVEATMEGQLTLVTRADGTGLVVVPYAIAISNGMLKGIVYTQFSPTTFDAKIYAFGGTGVLSGVTGYGTTQPTGPNTFLDQMTYRYA